MPGANAQVDVSPTISSSQDAKATRTRPTQRVGLVGGMLLKRPENQIVLGALLSLRNEKVLRALRGKTELRSEDGLQKIHSGFPGSNQEGLRA